jgi:hypothetical protein
MKSQAIGWLRVSYWAGAILDVLAGLVMVFPGLFAFLNRPADFAPGLDYRYAMGMGAPLMFAWTVLLLWADRKPLERRGVLPITLLVVAGEIATQVWGITVGFVPLLPMLPTFIMQAVMIGLFVFSYHNTREASA